MRSKPVRFCFLNGRNGSFSHITTDQCQNRCDQEQHRHSDDAKRCRPKTVVIVVVAGHARPFWQRGVNTRDVRVTDVHPVDVCGVVCVS